MTTSRLKLRLVLAVVFAAAAVGVVVASAATSNGSGGVAPTVAQDQAEADEPASAPGPPDHAVACGRRAKDAGLDPGEVCPEGDGESGVDKGRAGVWGEKRRGHGPPDHAVACGRRAKDAGLDPGEVCPEDDGESRDDSESRDGVKREGVSGEKGRGHGPPDHAVACGRRAKDAGLDPGQVCPDG